jgi:hypothetical protein
MGSCCQETRKETCNTFFRYICIALWTMQCLSGNVGCWFIWGSLSSYVLYHFLRNLAFCNQLKILMYYSDLSYLINLAFCNQLKILMYYPGLSYLIFLQLGQKVQVQNLNIPLEFPPGFSNAYFTFLYCIKAFDYDSSAIIIPRFKLKYIRTSNVRS